MSRGSTSGHAVPWTSPSTLFSIVCGVSLVFFMIYWPSNSESGAVINSSKSGPAPVAPPAAQQQQQQQPSTAGTSSVQQPSSGTGQRQQQYLLDTLKQWKDWGWSVTAGDAQAAREEEQDAPPAEVKVRLDMFAAEGNANAKACALALQPALEKLHPILNINTR